MLQAVAPPAVVVVVLQVGVVIMQSIAPPVVLGLVLQVEMVAMQKVAPPAVVAVVLQVGAVVPAVPVTPSPPPSRSVFSPPSSNATTWG